MKLITDKLAILQVELSEIDFSEIDKDINALNKSLQEKQIVKNDLVRQQRTIQAEIDILNTCLNKIQELEREE